MTRLAPTELINELAGPLADWLPKQRWFAGKDREIRAVRPVRATELVGDADPGLVHAVLAVEQDGGGRTGAEDLYQVLVGRTQRLPEHLAGTEIGTVAGETCYSAVHDGDLGTTLLDLIAADRDVAGVRFRPEPDAQLYPGLRSRPAGVEQSNTSLIFGHRYILKLYRRLHPGPSRDLELHRALHRVGCQHIAAPLGSIDCELRGEPVVLGVLQEYLSNAVDGWAMANTSVRDLMAEGDLHADEVGGDFAAEAYRLGEAVAAVHEDLRRALGGEEGDRDRLDAAVDRMHRRLDRVLVAVPELAPYEPALRRAFDAVRSVPLPLRLQQIHGDLHLGQVMRTNTAWVLIDFEGEPAAEVAERSTLRSPLRDIAGMLRSIDYAAHQILVGDEVPHQLEVRAAEWTERNRRAFCDGYAAAGVDPREKATLLRALELDKAVYEVGYEHANRPEWLAVPLAAVARMTAGEECA
ncbi:maltokinase N-terminal cap-like domain-containing protein [Gandjariella thermophila]|uniref:Maltokinase n=1 Tax=Gandjariella thermophila TaxID=1931992 RepID=A0A4D4JIX3_9PSEU|nr:aminoglycoside phosphotransferase [Gandjariella thermophila]GDY33843.1 aminoglycoside phosphotransferase [Gandjariella thermophila]